jgi:hypothetical protein
VLAALSLPGQTGITHRIIRTPPRDRLPRRHTEENRSRLRARPLRAHRGPPPSGSSAATQRGKQAGFQGFSRTSPPSALSGWWSRPGSTGLDAIDDLTDSVRVASDRAGRYVATSALGNLLMAGEDRSGGLCRRPATSARRPAIGCARPGARCWRFAGSSRLFAGVLLCRVRATLSCTVSMQTRRPTGPLTVAAMQ